jgi:taurine transport system permease protein
VTGYADARVHEHILHSVKLVLMGFSAAVLIGVPLGLAMGWSRSAEALVNPAFLLIRPIPPLAWIPLAIVWLGLGDGAKVLVIWFAAFVPSVINSYAGVRNIEPHLIEAARMLGVPRGMLVREILVPGALPMIFTGLRLSLQACWTTLVAAELIGALAGLGRVLSQSALDIFPAMIVVGMAGVALAGGLMTRALGWIELRAMPWRRA